MKASEDVGVLRPVAATVLDHEEARARWALFAVLSAIFLVPVALVRYPPVLDLAQQMAQLPLLEAALSDSSGLYEVDWLAPNRISYPLLAIGWYLGGAELGPRIGLAFCILALLGSIHYLGAALRRPLVNVVLASLFVWSSSLYGGFFNFLLGGWGLAFWLSELAATGPVRSFLGAFRRAFFIGLLFYLSHALWLVAAFGLLVVLSFRRPLAFAAFVGRAVALGIFVFAAAVWGAATVDPSVAEKIVYEMPITIRLFSMWAWAPQLLGGLKSAAEPLAVGAVAAWGLFAWLYGRWQPWRSLEPTLAVAALAFAGATIALPDTFQDTWFFARRWGPWVGICGALALPSPRLRPVRAIAFGLATVIAFVGFTAQVWRRFDRIEMSGFETCRRSVPAGSRVLFLDFDRNHPELWVYPTFQMSAYFQLDHEVGLSFSFAQHRSSLVRFREEHAKKPWKTRLEHRPREVRPQDFDFFDLALLHLPAVHVPTVHDRFPRLLHLTGEAEWHLYRVTENPEREPSSAMELNPRTER